MTDLANLLPWLKPDPEPEPDPDPIAAAHARGVAEAKTRARRTLTSFAVTDAARGILIDPSDAGDYLDLDALDPDDRAGIDGALNELVAAKPYLAVPPEPEPETGDGWLRRGWAPQISPGAKRFLKC